ncbi:MAG: polyketide synthase, partial [Acidobacteriota bacterium]
MSDRQRSGTGGLSPTKRALRALRDMRDRLDAVERGVAEPVAIVGMGCRFPKAAGLRAYWRLLAGGEDAVSEVPAERWDTHLLYDPDPSVRGKSVSRHGGFLDDLDRFDPEFFGISPREAPHVDPRQRLLLEVAWEALEDAGVPADSLAGTRTAVYVATLTNDYDQILARDPGRFEIYSGTGTANSVVANRLSYTFDLQGPSVALDTACSGSLQAIHLACQSLRTREASLALAGGVSVNLLPNGDILFSRAGTLSPDGRCQTFDRKANGIVRSEGAGLVVLKLLSRALADGDRVHAVIRGSAVNHTGRSAGIMAPDRRAQAAVLAEAYRQAGVSPGRVQYVEAHGTGTRAGDPIEVQALLEVLSEGRSDDLPLVLGSVKTNLGHTEAAAGVAGVIKTALALSHGFIPPNLHLEELNPALPTARFPLVIPDRGREWPAEPSGPEDGEQERIAGVSGFGFGGANAHVVLQEAPPPERPASGGAEADPDRVDAARTPLLTLSAAEPEALEDL